DTNAYVCARRNRPRHQQAGSGSVVHGRGPECVHHTVVGAGDLPPCHGRLAGSGLLGKSAGVLRRPRHTDPASPNSGLLSIAMSSSRITPVLVEIVRNGVIAVTEEMKTNLMRTAYNMIIYEALDFTVGLFTAEGETVSISLGLPTFIRGMAETI